MVKTFEELSENSLNKRKFDTLFVIYSRHILDAYKQFKWSVYNDSYHDGFQGRLESSGNMYHKFSISFEYRFNSKSVVSVIFHNNKNFGGQTFPITSTLPKGLGKLAQNIFKWNKSIIDKL